MHAPGFDSLFGLRTSFFVKPEWTDVKMPDFKLRTSIRKKTEWTDPNPLVPTPDRQPPLVHHGPHGVLGGLANPNRKLISKIDVWIQDYIR